MNIVATYDYIDEVGKLLYQVCRLDPKDFLQRDPDGKWETKGIRRVPFHLPQLLEAVKACRPVYIVEGEKDVLAMERAGFAATCNPGGAGQWQDGFEQYLKGADVIIIADKDASGRKHARDVAAKLDGIAATVKVIELPDTNGKAVKDAADYFTAGGQAADLESLSLDAPEWTPETPETEPVSGNAAKPSVIVVPSGNVTISKSARELFERIGPSNTLFWRGGAVVEVVTIDGMEGLGIVEAHAFRTRVEKFGNPFAWRTDREGCAVLKPTKLAVDDAKAMLASTEARELLPSIASILRCPVITETRDGDVAILGRGYHPELGGLLVMHGDTPAQMLVWCFSNGFTMADLFQNLVNFLGPNKRFWILIVDSDEFLDGFN